MTLEERLLSGCHQLGLKNPPIDALIAYLELLLKWNQAYNLTAIRDIDSMVSKHLLDSLAIAPYLKGGSLLDVGSGAGLPGIPLALTFPELKVTLLDSNGKKTRFLQEAKRVLQLKNVSVVQVRIEDYKPDSLFDTITSRAFSELSTMIQLSKHLRALNGCWLAMKGRYPEEELASLHSAYTVEVKTYTVPELEGERCSVIISRAQPQLIQPS